MHKRSKSKLTLTTQTVRVLATSELSSVVGGTQLVTVDDPITVVLPKPGGLRG